MDQVVYEMSSSSEASPSIFLKKNWVSIIDNNNQNYSSHQVVIDTSQLANSNLYMNYREAYLVVPLLITATSSAAFNPTADATSFDFGVGLKNNYASIIHSMSLDMQGTTIVQTTPFISLWNSFKLMTTLSYSDTTLWSSIGFYPDNSTSFEYWGANSVNGVGTCNNKNAVLAPVVTAKLNPQDSFNRGFYERQRHWNMNPNGLSGAQANSSQFSAFVTEANMRLQYRSHIFNTQRNSADATFNGVWQAQIQAVIMLRHLHSFFDKAPLLRGCFFRLTLNLNQSVVTTTTANQVFANTSVISPLGGMSPLMLASGFDGNGNKGLADATYTISLAVGSRCLVSTQTGLGGQISDGVMAKSVSLYIPSYVFNPTFEQAYLSQSVKNIEYSDLYFYQVLNQASNQNIQALISNGIAGLKSILVVPFLSAASNQGLQPIQSPFDPCGGGPTSPMCFIGNFNVVISGQNAIYNSQKYSFEAFLHNLHGAHSLNGGQSDGFGSGLIDQKDFENSYCYYHVNVERCLPVERSVTKSIQIVGTNYTQFALDLYIFANYHASVAVDVLSGARVS